MITTVSQNPDAIGYASLSAVKDSVKALTVGGVAPTEDTVKDGSYVIQRPFVLVTKDGTKLSDSRTEVLRLRPVCRRSPHHRSRRCSRCQLKTHGKGGRASRPLLSGLS